MEVVNVGKPEGVLVRLPLVPPVGPLDSPAVVEFGRGYGGDTVGLITASQCCQSLMLEVFHLYSTRLQLR